MVKEVTMIIGLDASRAVKAIKTGTEYYSWEILRHIVVQDSQVDFRLYAPSLPSEPFPSSSNIEWRLIPPKRLWSQIHLAKELRKHPPDVIFVPSHVIPFFSDTPAVVTIHDLAYLYYPDSYPKIERRYIAFSTAVSISKARAIITPSQATKKDIIKNFHCNQEKIFVIPHGYNRDLFNTDRALEKPPIDKPYILMIGRIEEKKNVAFLVTAFALFARENKEVRLVLAGKPGYGYAKIKQVIANLPASIGQRVIETGYLPQYDVLRYLRYAKLFAFPSRYEGFGMPVLEAMAMNVPVVCADTSSLPEVSGKAAIVLPTNQPLAWAASFSRLFHQKEYAQNIIKAQAKWVERFSWEKAARQTLEVIKHAAR